MQGLVTGASVSNQSGLAVDGTSLYWVGLTGVYKAPIGGGPATPVVPIGTPSGPLAIDASNVYWVSGGGVVQTPK